MDLPWEDLPVKRRRSATIAQLDFLRRKMDEAEEDLTKLQVDNARLKARVANLEEGRDLHTEARVSGLLVMNNEQARTIKDLQDSLDRIRDASKQKAETKAKRQANAEN